MENQSVRVDVEADEAGVISKLCQILEEASKDAIKQRDNFIVAVSGGSVVNMLVKGLPLVKTCWSKWIIVFCDERLVSESDTESTFGLYKRDLLPVVDLTPEQFLTIDFSLIDNAEKAAEDYELRLKQRIPSSSVRKDPSGTLYPRLDCAILGMGPDGHTCSLFPGHRCLSAVTWVTGITDSPKPPPSRITLTLPLLNSAELILFPIVGSSKSQTIQNVLKKGTELPAGLVKPYNGLVRWILDQSAASLIKS